jgi:hypothetical protein
MVVAARNIAPADQPSMVPKPVTPPTKAASPTSSPTPDSPRLLRPVPVPSTTTAKAPLPPRHEVAVPLTAATAAPGEEVRSSAGPESAATTAPEDSSDFEAAASQVRVDATQQKQHPPAKKKRVEVEKAAVLPTEDQEKQSSKERITEKMEEVGADRLQAGKEFSADEFKAELRRRIEANPPKTETQAREMAKSDALARGFEDDFSGKVAVEQGKVINPLKDAAAKEPPAGHDPAIRAVAIPTPVYPAPPEAVDPALVTPKPLPDEAVSLQHESDRLEGAMQNNRLSDDQLAQSREPDFEKALRAKQAAEHQIVVTREVYRQQETELLEKATIQADQSLSAGLGGMNDRHTRAGALVAGRQGRTETHTEKRQREIKECIDHIYQQTVEGVTSILGDMATTVKTDFTAILKKQTNDFNENLKKRLSEYYTTGKKIKHFFLGEPKVVIENGKKRELRRDDWDLSSFPPRIKTDWINPHVYDMFVTEKNKFVAAMDMELEGIAKNVEIGLKSANLLIALGKLAIKMYKATLKGDERQFADQLEQEVLIKFDTLEGSIDDAREDLLQSMADDYRATVGQLETSFREMNDELRKTWIDKAVDFIETVAKTIYELADLVFTVLRRVYGLVWDIIKHPIRFFETLVAGLKRGISSFIRDIGTHLQEAFWTWITGATAVTNIRLSVGSGVASLFDLVMQLLRLGPAELRAIVDKVLGPEFMQIIDQGLAFAEKAIEPVTILVKKGPLAFWHYLEETLSTTIKASFDRIKESVFYAFIEKALKWIAGFFIPGGGFVKVVKAILRAFQFVAENLPNIRRFFDSVFDSMEAAIHGNSDGVAARIIVGLKTGVVLALNFLARQFDLNSIISRVHDILNALRRPIVAAIEWVLRKVKPLVNRILATVRRVGAAVLQAGLPKDPAERLRLGLNAAAAAVNALRGRAVTAALINPLLRAIKVRYGFETLQPVESAGDWWVEGEVNPKSRKKTSKRAGGPGAVTGQLTISRLVVKRPAKDKDKPSKLEIARATSGRAWQDALNAAVIKEILVPRWETVLKVPIEIVVRGQKEFAYPSRTDLARLKIDRGHRAGRAGVFPDVTMEVRQPTGTALKEVRFVEVTLVEDFTAAGDFAQHKIQQFTSDVQIMIEKYGPNVPVKYFFAAPRPPTIATEQFIVDTVRTQGATNFTVQWFVVEHP